MIYPINSNYRNHTMLIIENKTNTYNLFNMYTLETQLYIY